MAANIRHGGPKFLVIILNYHLPRCTPFMFQKASFRVVADGGANRLYHEVPALLGKESESAVRERFIPNCIVGDLDSIKPEICEYYKGKGVSIISKAEDQDSNDLTKCINTCLDFMSENSLSKEDTTIFALGALGGRLDHTMGNLNVLFSFQDLKVVLCGDNNLTRMLPAGDSVICPDLSVEGPTCGLIPIGAPVTATTTGLKWNLDGDQMAFGGLVSTSNIIDSEEIRVSSSGPLLWTTEFKDQEVPGGLCGLA